MKYFSQDFLAFFSELEENNSKAWFDSQKARYQASVKEPFEQFITDLLQLVGRIEPFFECQPKDAIFRINRDIRFSKNKSPYKTNTSAGIANGGRKENPLFYIQLGHKESFIAGGAYELSKEQLASCRAYIVEYGEDLDKVLGNVLFKKYYGEIRGEKNKVLPTDFKQYATVHPLLYNKQLYCMAGLSQDAITSNRLIDIAFEHYVAVKPLNDLLRNMISFD
jgi:uncharacterized protein (TIGR02453 family)